MGDNLPADIPAFLTEVEARAAYADPNDSDVRRFYNAKSCADVPALVAIVREQGATHLEAVRHCNELHRPLIAKLETENAELRKAYVLASETTAATVKENCALRERLAKLETAVRATGESLEGCTLSHPDGITVALLRLEELRELVTP